MNGSSALLKTYLMSVLKPLGNEYHYLGSRCWLVHDIYWSSAFHLLLLTRTSAVQLQDTLESC